MNRETDAADSLGESGSPRADKHLCENFGLTVNRVRGFDPQTLDVTLACKFLGLPLKRFDRLGTQPEARDRWVESVARQKKVLIELYPEAGRELKDMLEAIRKFATRKCLNPDGPARLDGHGSGAHQSRTQLQDEVRQLKVRTRLLVGGVALAAVALAGGAVAALAVTRSGAAPPAAATSPPAAKPVAVPAADPFAVNSVWSGDGDQRRVLTVTGRLGESFTAKFLVGDRIEREVQGRVRDGKVSWLAKDVRAVRGGVGVDSSGTIRIGPGAEAIDFNRTDKDGEASTFTLTKSGGIAAAKSSHKPSSPSDVLNLAQALQGKAGDAVTVQFGVASADLTPVKRLLLLNSEADHLDAKNFVVVLTPKARGGRWKDATAATFVGQTIRVDGTLSLSEGKLQLLIEDEAAIKLLK